MSCLKQPACTAVPHIAVLACVPGVLMTFKYCPWATSTALPLYAGTSWVEPIFCRVGVRSATAADARVRRLYCLTGIAALPLPEEHPSKHQ